MGAWGIILLAAGAIVLAFAGEAIGRRRFGAEPWLVALGAVIGGFAASEYLGAASTWGWQVDGLYVFPALIGAVIVGGLVELLIRALISGTETPRHPTST